MGLWTKGISRRLLKTWLSEDRAPASLLAMQIKRALKVILPLAILSALKPSYYRWLHRHAAPLDDPTVNGARALLKQGDFAVDIGASVGFYTRALSEIVGSTGLVWAVEPVRETLVTLESIARGLKNVHVYPYALSDTVGPAQMAIPRISYGESLYGARLIDGPSTDRTVHVHSTTPDALLQSQDLRPRLLKIDVEGHEVKCLRGAHQTLMRWHPALLIETLEHFTPGAVVTAALTAYGYAPYQWDGQFVPQSGPYLQDTFYLAD